MSSNRSMNSAMPLLFFKPIPLKKQTAIIIRSYEVMSYDEIQHTLKLAGLFHAANANLPQIKQDFPDIANSLSDILTNALPPGGMADAYSRVYKKIQSNVKFRQFLEKQVRSHGNELILHGDHDTHTILQRLHKIPETTRHTILIITGGHGLTNYALSGILRPDVQKITEKLKKMGLVFHAIALGSCYSASFVELFRPLLNPDGVMISDTIPCGGQNHYNEVINFLLGENKHLLSFTHQSERLLDRKRLVSQLVGNMPLSEIKDTALEALYQDLRQIDLNQLNHVDITRLKSTYSFLEAGFQSNIENTIQLSKLPGILNIIITLLENAPGSIQNDFRNQLADYLTEKLKDIGRDERLYAQIFTDWLITQSIHTWHAFKRRYSNGFSRPIDLKSLNIDLIFHAQDCTVSLLNPNLCASITNKIQLLIQTAPNNLRLANGIEFRELLNDYLSSHLNNEFGIDGKIYTQICNDFCFSSTPKINSLDELAYQLTQINKYDLLVFEKKKPLNFIESDDIEFKALLENILTAENQLHLTGKCISTPAGHQALRFDEHTTGIPLHAAADDYQNNHYIVRSLSRSAGKHHISSDLKKVNMNEQITFFNNTFHAGLQNIPTNDYQYNWLHIGLATASVIAAGAILTYTLKR